MEEQEKQTNSEQFEKKDFSEPRVEVFGEKMNDDEKDRHHHHGHHCHCRHHRGGGVVIGLFILFAGIILLLNSTGLATWQFWHIVSNFWPVLLILFGLEIVLGRNIFSRTVILILALIFFITIIAYGLIQAGSPLAGHLPISMINFINSLK